VSEKVDTTPELVRAERLVAGGAALARRDDGQVVLVDDALPGELVEVTIARRRGAVRGEIVRVVEPSPDRIEPRCPHVVDGCGGCDLAALGHGAQVDAKVELVADSLRRLGRWREPVVHPGPELDPWGFRTTLRLAVTDGRAGLRKAASNDVVALDHCLVAHPRLDELIVEGRFGGASYVTLRVGATTGERLALVAPTRAGVSLPDDVRVVGLDELAAGAVAFVHDDVAGRRWRISAGSFFQTRTDGADALVDVVRRSAGDVLDREAGVLVDAYSGVGLFAGALLDGLDGLDGRRTGWRAVTAESDRSSVADAQVNLAHLDARIVETTVERFRAPRADLVVADPSRAGLEVAGAAVLASTRAERIVLVSCDPAAAGRDVGILKARGYRPIESTVVDLFPHTHHVEVVTRFDRTSP
jgi:23S rRNA (uracil1939-C5)-methyltransferase